MRLRIMEIHNRRVIACENCPVEVLYEDHGSLSLHRIIPQIIDAQHKGLLSKEYIKENVDYAEELLLFKTYLDSDLLADGIIGNILLTVIPETNFDEHALLDELHYQIYGDNKYVGYLGRLTSEIFHNMKDIESRCCDYCDIGNHFVAVEAFKEFNSEEGNNRSYHIIVDKEAIRRGNVVIDAPNDYVGLIIGNKGSNMKIIADKLKDYAALNFERVPHRITIKVVGY